MISSLRLPHDPSSLFRYKGDIRGRYRASVRLIGNRLISKNYRDMNAAEPSNRTHAGHDAPEIQLKSRQLPCRCFDLDVHTCWQTQFIERFNRLGRSLNDIDKPLVCTNLELLTSLLVDARTRKDRVSLDSRWQRNRAMHFAMRSFDSVNDFLGALIEHRMIVRLHADADNFVRSSRHGGTLPIRNKHYREGNSPQIEEARSYR